MKKRPVTYDFSCTIRDIEIKYRKWKVKDRKEFIKIISDENNISETEAANTLVYNCLENPNITLSVLEFKYVLSQIRKESIGRTLKYDLTCSECEFEMEIEVEIDDIVKKLGTTFKNIEASGMVIELGEVVNKKFYDEKIATSDTSDFTYLIDFLLHIKKIDGDDTFSFAELLEFAEDMDVDTLDAVFTEWDKQRFNLDDTKEITCQNPDCEHKETYSFDEMPEFFPTSWFER